VSVQRLPVLPVPTVELETVAPQEPVAVMDTVNDQAGLEHQSVRDHRVVVGSVYS
jgi:hypothetical protein